MKRTKYWGKRLRLAGDAVSGTIAALSIAYSGLANGHLVIQNITGSVIGLIAALAIWGVMSFISGEMDDDNAPGNPTANELNEG